MSVDAATEPSAAQHDTAATAVHYRYPGSPPFQDTELDRRLFRGRAEEADTVLHSILSSELFLLYAVSGMGKTSLLNAGVMHPLRERGHWPVSVRLNDPSKRPVVEIREQLEAAAEVDPEIELVWGPGTEGATATDTSLWDLLASLDVWRRNDLQRPVVVFDQFEELFTLGWDEADRDEFIRQFGEVVRGHRLHAAAGPNRHRAPPDAKFVLVIREDHLGELEALATDVPQIMRNRFRLGALDPVQAAAAIREPARVHDGRLDSQPFIYTEAAADEILNFLRTTTERGEEVRTNRVDPPQLQIVCQYVERTILPAKAAPAPGDVVQIDAPDLGGREGLERILGDFYRRTLQTFPASQQKSVRQLCERGLVNPAGRRLSLEEGEIETEFGVTTGMLHQLVDERLLRADPRVGSVYYELAHDTLVPPIRAYAEEDAANRRRRQRRWIAVAAALAGIVLVSLLAFTLGSDSGDNNTTMLTLSVGQTASGLVAEPGARVLFAIEPDDDQILLVSVRPIAGAQDGAGSTDGAATSARLNVALDLTTEDGAGRDLDQLGVGQREQLVVAPVGRQVLSVTSKDTTTGPFEVTLQEVTVIDVGPGSVELGNIAAPGAVAVFGVEITGGTPMVVDVASPTPTDGGQEGQGRQTGKDALDAEIELLDPTGISTEIDTLQAGNGERVQVSGIDGRYVIVVRAHEDSTGQFRLDAKRVTRTLSAGQPEKGEIDGTKVAEFTYDLPEGGSHVAIILSSGAGFDGVLNIAHPNGASTGSDSAGEEGVDVALIGPDPGHYLIDVTGYESSTGPFTLEATVVDQTLVADQPDTGEIIGADPGLFVLEVPEDSPPLLVMVTPDASFDPVIGMVGPDGAPRLVDDQGEGGSEAALVSAAAGSYLVGVGGYDSSTGGFEVVAGPVAARMLALGDSVSASGPMVFDVPVPSGQVYELAADPSSPETSVVIHAQDADGYSIGDSAGEAGEPASVLADSEVADTYRVLVIGSGGDGDYTVTVTGEADG